MLLWLADRRMAGSCIALHCGNLARPERFEPSTFWFAGRLAFFSSFQFNRLDGPPLPNLSPRLAESRRNHFRRYAGE